jgi:hypothetical protein
MTTLALNGGSTPDVSTSFTDKWVETSSGVSLPTNTRLAANGTRPCYVASIRVYWAGRLASRKLRVLVGGISTATVTVPSDSSANLSSVLALGASFTGGGVKTVRIDANPDGSFYFGRESGTGSVDSYGTSFGQLSGSVEYYEVPTAPTAVTVTQAALENAVNVAWSAPSSDGGSAIKSYTIQWSYTADFATSTTISTASTATSYKITGLAYGSVVYVKVAAVNLPAEGAGTTSVFSSSANGYITPPDLPLNGWANFGSHGHSTFEIEHTSIPALIPETGIQRKATSTSATGTYATGNFGIEKTYTGLTIGRQYILSGKAILLTAAVPGNIYRFAVNGIGNGTSVTLTSTSVGATIPSYTFTASATSHTVQIELAETVSAIVGVMEHVAFYDYALTRVATDLTYRVQDNDIEASLADHFDLATQSVGAYWWVDRFNETKFTQDFDYTLPLATFSDVTGTGNLYYTDISTSFDTSTVINEVTLNNAGVRNVSYESVNTEGYTTTWTDSDATSIDDWGARKYDLQTNLWTQQLKLNVVPNPHFAYNSDNIASPNSSTSFTRALLSDMATGATRFITAGATQPVDTIGNYIGVITCSALKTTLALIHSGNEQQEGGYGAFPVRPSTQYTGSSYVRGGVGQASMNANVQIRWFDVDGKTISTVSGTVTTLTSTGWGRRTVTATSPANAYSANLIVQFGFTGANNTGNRYFATGSQMELGASATTWFSGDTPDDTTYFYEWEGDPGSSRSIIYENTIDTRATEILNTFSTPTVLVNSLTYNTAQAPTTAAQIDVGSLVVVTFKGTTTTYRVTGISHDINPERWMSTLQLAKVT